MSFASFAKALPPSLSLAGRTALITGSSSGIGRQTALHLARAGASVLCTDLQPEPLGTQKAPSEVSRHVPTHDPWSTMQASPPSPVVSSTNRSKHSTSSCRSTSRESGLARSL
ncbi:hypothetical protein, partial [Sporisorium scitamineum]